MNLLNHPLVRESDGGGMCPVQYEGRLTDGRYFYFRYRSGWASIGLGETPDEAIRERREAGLEHGDPLQGFFDSDAERDDVFARVLTLRLAKDATP